MAVASIAPFALLRNMKEKWQKKQDFKEEHSPQDLLLEEG